MVMTPQCLTSFMFGTSLGPCTTASLWICMKTVNRRLTFAEARAPRVKDSYRDVIARRNAPFCDRGADLASERLDESSA